MPRTADLFGTRPRRPPRVLMRVIDAGLSGHHSEEADQGATMWVRLQCRRCHEIVEAQATVTEARKFPCPKCNPTTPPTT